MISFAQFSQNIVPFTLKYEGYYANVSGDTGGETYRGISRVHNPGWAGWSVVDKLKPLKHNQNIPQLEDSVKQYYFDKYFCPKGFQRLDTKIAMALFDFAVHGGYSGSKFKSAVSARYKIPLSVSSVITDDDGKALSRIDSSALADIALHQRSEHLRAIITKNPSQAKFSTGWQLRINSLADVLSVVIRHPIRTALGIGVVVFASVFFFSLQKILNDACLFA